MSTPLDRNAWRFFHKQAGYVVGERALGAAALARAEAQLQRDTESGQARTRWLYDEFADLSWADESVVKRIDNGELEVRGCVVESRCPACGQWDFVASLWGIAEPPGTAPYKRVIEAELALERQTQ